MAAECLVCFCDEEIGVVSGCPTRHPICKDCLSTFIRISIESRDLSQLHCPGAACPALITAQEIQEHVSPELYQLFLHLMSPELDEQSLRAKGQIDPTPVSDLDFKDLNTKRSPGCQILCEKNGGSNDMWCTKCRHYWCWLCSSVLSSSEISLHYTSGPCAGLQYFEPRTKETTR